jgi:hypothetical protein
MPKYREAMDKLLVDSSEANLKSLMQPLWLFIVHRTITTQYTGNYLDEPKLKSYRLQLLQLKNRGMYFLILPYNLLIYR